MVTGTAVTFVVSPATSDYGTHMAVVEEMLWTSMEEKCSLFPSSELSQYS